MKKVLLSLIIFITMFVVVGCQVKTHEVRFNYNNGQEETVEKVNNGEFISKLIEPIKEGFVFKGWFEDDFKFTSETKVFRNYNLVAKWDVQNILTYQVILKYNNGIEDLHFNVNVGESINEIIAPVKEGYKFIGWYLNDELFSFDTLVTKDLVLEAKYEVFEEVKIYDVTLIYNNGLDNQTIKVVENSTLIELKEPTRDGYIFLGWYLNELEFPIDTKITSNNIILTAKWEKEIVVTTYDVILKYDNGMQDVKLVVEENSILDSLNDPIKPGYNFIGWFVEDEKYDFNSKVVTDLTIVAKYELIVVDVYHLVTLIFDNGFTNQTFKVKENTLIKDLIEPTKEGYIFLGWYLNDIIFDYTNEVISNDIILEAKWEEIYVEVNYTITYNLNNGLKDIIVVVNENDIVSKPEDPSRIGYIFIGWFLDDIEFIFNNHINSDLTIDAHWVKETVKYNVEIVLDNGQQNISYRVIEFEKVTKPQDPVKNGYNFIGWYLGDNVYDFNSEVTSNIRIEARYRLLTSQDKVVRAIQLHKDSTNFTIVGKGTVSTRLLFSVTQNINIKKSRNGDQIYLFNATYSSMANTFAEYDGTINSGNASVGNVDKNFKKTGTPNTEIKSYDDHITKYGGGVNDNNYIINYDTITNINEVSNNKFNLTLSLTDSIENYKTNISSMNPYESRKESIKFSKINITITLNEIGYFETIEYDEVYQLELNIPILQWKNQTMTSKITETYTYNN